MNLFPKGTSRRTLAALLARCRFAAAVLVLFWSGGLNASAATTAVPAGVTFENDVEAVLAKAGCSLGTCHGNATGKGGFKLSLRGFDPDFDFAALTREQFGRRVNLLEPDRSLILRKALAQIAHEGGQRFATNSWEHQTLRDWIAAGAPRTTANAPRLVKLEVTPAEQILLDPAATTQINARAVFSDGSTRDVTRTACYEAVNVGLAAVNATGGVTRLGFGETTVLVRFLHLQQPVRLAFVPARPGFRWSAPPPHNFIDEHVFAKLQTLRLNPSAPAPDEVFLRRAFLDLLGILPTPEQARAFLADARTDKRPRLVDQLLERPEFADFWALKWADLLRVEVRSLDPKGVQAFHHWIRESVAANRPMDQFARAILTARGSTYANPAANFHRASRTAAVRGEAVAQVFLGTRLQCAQCHNHPFDRWTQDDYYDWAAVFAKLDYKVLENKPLDRLDKNEFRGEQIVFLNHDKKVTNPRTEKSAAARLLGVPAATLNADTELESLADWITRPDNPFFARALVNRVWFHLLGRGLVDPIDDFRPTNPASHPALVEALAADFVKNGYDLRHLIRTITASRAYQVSSEPNDTNGEDELNYSRAIVRRLSAEQMFDGLHQVAGVTPDFKNYPAGLRAAELPAERSDGRRKRKVETTPDQFLSLFGKPQRQLVCECERSAETTMGQAFQMISGPAVNDLISRSDNRLNTLLAGDRPLRPIVEELYWFALTRAPSPAEQDAAARHFEKTKDRRAGLEDLLWGLMNAKEFILRR